MNNYKSKDIISLSGVSYGIFRKLRDNGYFKDMALIGGLYFFSQNDLDRLIFDLTFSKNSYTTKEVEPLLGKVINQNGSKIVQEYSLTIDIDYILFRKQYFFNKDSINTIVKTINSASKINSDYLLVSECIKLLDYKTNYIYDGIRQGHIKDYLVKSKHQKYISIDEFDKLKREVEIIKDSYLPNQIAKLFGVSSSDLALSKLKKIQHTLIRNQSYYLKSEVDNIINQYSSREEAYKNYFSRSFRVTGEIKKLDLPVVDSVPNGYLSTNEMCQKYGYSQDVFRESIRNGRLKKCIRYKRKIYISTDEFEAILNNLNNTISIKDAVQKVFEDTGVKIPLINISNVKSYFPSAFLSDLLGLKHYRITNEDFEYFMNNKFEEVKITLLSKEEKDPYKLYKLLISGLPYTPYKFTLSEYNQFSINTLNQSNAKSLRNIAYNLYSSLKALITILTKEFNTLTDTEIEKLLLSLDSNKKLYVSNFLNFFKKKNPTACVYSNHYNRYVSVDITNKIDDIYSETQWFNYLSYLTDVNLHIEKAFSSQQYSRIWLYSLLHFIVAWRRGDIISLPNLDILDIDKYNIEWFINNTFTMTDAQYIVNSTKLVFDNVFANKTDVKNHFVPYPSVTIPLAVSIIIAEKHRRLNNSNLLGNTCFAKSDFTKYFKDNLDGFKSRKANNTLLSLCHNEATNKEGFSEISYSLSSYLRSHKKDKYGIAPSTQIYIYSTNKDGDANNVALQLQKRGVFGWLYKSILDITYNSYDYTLNDTTNAIDELKDSFSVKNLEGISKFLQVETINNNMVIKELLSMDKLELKDLIKKLLKGNLSSKISYTYCIKPNNCPYKTNTNCYCCKYSIPTNYTLLIINNKLNELMDKLNDCNEQDTTERIYYTHQIIKLLRVINQAKKDFLLFDSSNKSYLDAFLNIETLKEKFDQIKSTKLLLKE